MTEQVTFERFDVARTASPDGLLDVAVLSPALGRRADLTLFTPPGHEDAAGLPIVILLHGVYGSHWAWARSGLAHLILAEMVAAGRTPPVVLAMPSDGLFGVGSGYLQRAGEDSERWIHEEVPAAVRRVLPAVDADDVSVAGLSMGGWGALRLAGRHPETFRAAVGMSPLSHLSQVAAYAPEPLRAAHAPAVDDDDLGDLLVRRAAELPPLRITCGVDDELIGSVRRLHARLDAAGVRHKYAEAGGGHEWDYWGAELRNALVFFDQVRRLRRAG